MCGDLVLSLQYVPVSFLLYIATKKAEQIITVNTSTNALITKKITHARFACLCFDKLALSYASLNRPRRSQISLDKFEKFVRCV